MIYSGRVQYALMIDNDTMVDVGKEYNLMTNATADELYFTNYCTNY
jgi:hypothetical protein